MSAWTVLTNGTFGAGQPVTWTMSDQPGQFLPHRLALKQCAVFDQYIAVPEGVTAGIKP